MEIGLSTTQSAAAQSRIEAIKLHTSVESLAKTIYYFKQFSRGKKMASYSYIQLMCATASLVVPGSESIEELFYKRKIQLIMF